MKYAANILRIVLKELNVHHTPSFTNSYFLQNHNNDNLLGLAQMLSVYKVESRGLAISDNRDFFKIPTPFVAHVDNNFVLVTDVTPDQVSYVDKGERKIAELYDFYRRWSGAVLMIEATKESIEPNYIEHRNQYWVLSGLKLVFLAVALGGILVSFIANDIYSKLSIILLIELNIVGIYISYLLLLKQLKIASRSADALCSINKDNDCNDILNSKAAKFFDTISWSEIGFSYFVCNIVALICFPNLLSYVVLINIIALPYSFWSLWYQRYVVKRWCPLCLIVIIVLWLIFIANSIWTGIHAPIFNIFEVITILWLYMLTIGTTYLVMQFLQSKTEVNNLNYRYNRFVYDQNIFSYLLKQQPHFDMLKSEVGWGNYEAGYQITVLTNPHCKYCSDLHQQLTLLYNNLYVQYIVISFDPRLYDNCKILIAAHMQFDYHKAKLIFDDWFETGQHNAKAFADKYKIDITDVRVEAEFDKHMRFWSDSGVMQTPTIFVNGSILPKGYNLDNIIYFLNLDSGSR